MGKLVATEAYGAFGVMRVRFHDVLDHLQDQSLAMNILIVDHDCRIDLERQ